jgi:hypothetical protein
MKYGDDYTIQELIGALEESLTLQAHYATLLNMYDGGQRMIFETSESWIKRLRETGAFST